MSSTIADGQHIQGPYLTHPQTGQTLYTHRPTIDNPIVTYSRGKTISKDANAAYQYYSWNGLGVQKLTQNVLGNELFKKGFENYLPKRFIDHYTLAKGQTYVMNRQEMNDVNMVPIGIGGSNPAEFERFNKAIEGLQEGQYKPVKNWTIQTGALNSGTLGNFYVTVNGAFTGIKNSDGTIGWKFEGTLQMNDYWDFDPDASGTKRPAIAEKLVRFANAYLKGTPFKITSELVFVSQTSHMQNFNYATNSVVIPNRVTKGLSAESKVARKTN
ncbi:MAG TPA: hypothetical protein VEB42_08130 [Chitinophagaceae bacterium]|nr:hypothetical protein [Chitinophagaceae bacterium]